MRNTLTKSVIDKAINAGLLAVSPRRYVARQHCRRMDNDGEYRDAFLLSMRLRGYRAARSDEGRAPWNNSSRSADGEIISDLPVMRNRSRELNRDDSLGSGVTKTFVANIIGTGMVAQARTGDPEKDNLLEDTWKARRGSLSLADDLMHGETQRLLIRKVFEDGEVLRKAVYSIDEPVWFETIEADRLATPSGKLSDPLIRDGVERDRSGRIVAYWIAQAPASDFSPSSLMLHSGDYVRVEKEFVRHLKITDRPGQTRGVPLCHAIMQDIRDLDHLMNAALRRTDMAACLAAFIKSPALFQDLEDTHLIERSVYMDRQITPGNIYKLFPGEELQTLIPNFPTPEFVPFIIMLARRIGAALGICWSMVLKDFSQSNYSSARTDLLESRQTFRIWQDWFIEKYLNWEWSIVMQDALLRGEKRLRSISPIELDLVQWIPNGWPWIDPQNEAAASEIGLRIGTTTLREICAQNGQDWEEVQDQRLKEEAREMKSRKALGLHEKINPDAPPPQPKPNNQPKERVIEDDFLRERTNGNGHRITA